MGDYKGKLDTLYWSPSEIAQLASDLVTWGTTVEENIKAAYVAIDSLGTSGSWTGKLFNDLAEMMNDQKGYFQKAMTVLIEEIPSALNESAHQQADASDAAYPSFNAGSASSDYEISLTEDNGTGILTFDESEAEAKNSDFTTALQTADDNLSSYESNFNSLFNEVLSARAQAFEKYRYIVESTVSTCKQRFGEFAEAFVTNANAAKAAIQAADAASAASADNVGDVG